MLYSSGGGQTDADGGCRSCARGARSRWGAADRAVPARRPARPQPAPPDRVHARTAVPSGAGVWQGELRLQAPPLRAGHGSQLTGDDHKGMGATDFSVRCIVLWATWICLHPFDSLNHTVTTLKTMGRRYYWRDGVGECVSEGVQVFFAPRSYMHKPWLRNSWTPSHFRLEKVTLHWLQLNLVK